MSTELDRCTLIFQELGLSRIEGRMIYVLLAGNPLSARQIEKSTALRQPEVSKAAEKLLEKGWIKEKLDISVGMGRPQKIYVLRIDTGQIYEKIYSNNSALIQAKITNLLELKELLCKVK